MNQISSSDVGSSPTAAASLVIGTDFGAVRISPETKNAMDKIASGWMDMPTDKRKLRSKKWRYIAKTKAEFETFSRMAAMIEWAKGGVLESI